MGKSVEMKSGLRETLLGMTIFLFGCTTTAIPLYLPEKKPYVKRFYADYDKILAAVATTLKDLGWVVEDQVSPSVYEGTRESDLDEKQLLIITQVRELPLFVGSRYARMNIFVRSRAGISEVEIRYLTLSTLTFKKISDYSNDAETKRIFGKIDEVLQELPTPEVAPERP